MAPRKMIRGMGYWYLAVQFCPSPHWIPMTEELVLPFNQDCNGKTEPHPPVHFSQPLICKRRS